MYMNLAFLIFLLVSLRDSTKWFGIFSQGYSGFLQLKPSTYLFIKQCIGMALDRILKIQKLSHNVADSL